GFIVVEVGAFTHEKQCVQLFKSSLDFLRRIQSFSEDGNVGPGLEFLISRDCVSQFFKIIQYRDAKAFSTHRLILSRYRVAVTSTSHNFPSDEYPSTKEYSIDGILAVTRLMKSSLSVSNFRLLWRKNEILATRSQELFAFFRESSMRGRILSSCSSRVASTAVTPERTTIES